MSIRVLLLILILTGCSSMKRTMLVTSLSAGAIGGVGGAIYSPDRESIDKNAFLFSLLGAGLGALGGYLLHDTPEEQREQKSMILEEPTKLPDDIPLFDFSEELKNIKPNITFKPVNKYEVPLEKLPPELEGKVKKQFILEYQSEARTLTIGNRTIQISPFKAWENVYEE